MVDEQSDSAMNEFVDFFGDEAGEVLGRVLDERAEKRAGKPDRKPDHKPVPADERRAAVAAAEAEEDAALDRIVGPVETDDDKYNDGLSDVDVSDEAVFNAIDSGDDKELRLIKRAQEYTRDQAFYDTGDGRVGV